MSSSIDPWDRKCDSHEWHSVKPNTLGLKVLRTKTPARRPMINNMISISLDGKPCISESYSVLFIYHSINLILVRVERKSLIRKTLILIRVPFETATKFGEYGRKKRRQPPVTVASLRLFLRSSTGPNRRFQPQSLGRVRDPVRIAEGPTAIDAATQRRHFGFRLWLVDMLQPIGGARQRPRREDGKRRVFALHTAQTRPTPRFRSLHEVGTQGVPLHVANDLVEVVFCFHRKT